MNALLGARAALAGAPRSALCYDVFTRAKKDRPVRVRPLGFRPPQVNLDAEVEWVLQRAFGPLEWLPTRHISGQRLVDVALRLDMAARVASRHPRALIEREMGSTAAHRLREQFVATVARSTLLDHALSELVSHAHAAKVPCVLLKYAALSRMGVLRIGSRAATDLDVLVPNAQAREFQAFLIGKGYQELGLPESSHQLAALQSSNGLLIELHLHVPLVTLAPGLPFAEVEHFQRAGLVFTTADNALVPDLAVLAAHAIAHGLMQHAQVPQVCSPLKTFADLADLQLAKPGTVEKARGYLIRTMTAEDLTSVEALNRALQHGDLQAAMNGGAGVILRHALASQLDRRYAAWLRLGGLGRNRGTSVRRTPAQLYKSLRAAWHWLRTDATRVL